MEYKFMKNLNNKIEKTISETLRKSLLEDIEEATTEEMSGMMSAMEANMNKQNEPCVGIFWYSPIIKDLFGVVSVNAYDQAKIENRNEVSCKELHKNIWKKKYNYYKFNKKNSIESKLFKDDYKKTPRGRIFYYPETDEFIIMVGSWIKEYPEAILLIKDIFNLNDPNLYVRVKIGIHWEIGMGYGD